MSSPLIQPNPGPAGTTGGRGLHSTGLLTLLVCGLVLVQALAATAAAPEFMTYQGFLVDANGAPLATNKPANYPVIFRIFAAQTGGQALWGEQQIVTVDRGNFSVILGEGTPVSGQARPPLSTLFSGASSSDRYLSLSVTINGTTSEMLPRLRLLPGAYAFHATEASYLVNPAGTRVISVDAEGMDLTGALSATGSLSVGGALSAASLNVTGQTTFSSPLAIRPQGGNEGAEIVMQGTGGSNPEWRFDTAGNQIRFHSGGVVEFSVNTAGNGFLAGNLGLGVAAPASRLHVNGGVKIEGINSLELGSGVAGKQADAGRIAYQLFTGDALDVVGAGTSGANRKIKFWTEGGAEFNGNITANGAIRARGGVPGPSGSLNNGFSFTGNGGDNDSGMFSSADGQLEFYGNSSERLRILSNGNVGINTTTPGDRLEVNGGVRITGNNTLEFGAGVVGKEGSAGKIGYQQFTANALDIVGAGTTGGNRRVHVWAEGGTAFTGSVGIRTASPSDALHVSAGGALRVDTLVNGVSRYIRMYRVPEGLILEGNIMRNPNNQPASGFGRVVWDGDGNFDEYSDRRIKKDIIDAESVLSRVMQVQVRRFHWTNQVAGDPRRFGVIAQELEPHFPDLVGSITDPEHGQLMTVNQGGFGLIAVKATQELKTEKDSQITALKQEIAVLKEEVALLKNSRTAQVDSMQDELNSLRQIVRRLAAASTGDSSDLPVASTTQP